MGRVGKNGVPLCLPLRKRSFELVKGQDYGFWGQHGVPVAHDDAVEAWLQKDVEAAGNFAAGAVNSTVRAAS